VQKKIFKAFGKDILKDDRLLQQAEICKRITLREQRKTASLFIDIILPLLPMYLVAIMLMAFDSLTGPALWHSLSTLLDGVQSGTMSVEELQWLTIQNQIKFVFCVFAHLTSWTYTHKVTSQFRVKVRTQLMANMVRQDTAFFDIIPSGILQERLNRDAEDLASKIFHLPLRIINCIGIITSNVYAVYCLQPKLCTVIFAPLPLISVAQYYIIKVMERLGNRQRKLGEESAAGTQEILREIRTVREFAMEDEEAEKFAVASSYRAEIEEYGSALHHIVFIAPLVCTMVATRNFSTFLGASYVAAQTLTVGQAVQIGFAADHLQHCIRDLMDMVPEIITALNPLGRICDMLNSKPKIEPVPSAPMKLRPERFEGQIQFINVEFTFPSEPHKPILNRLSFSVNPGEKVAFVGSTGCGKSTSIKLIERFYAPTAGTILLDGRPIDTYDVHHLRRHMSVVAQETVLFSTTIRENIIYGLLREERACISDAEIERACRRANAWDFIQEFPRGLETYAGEKGVKMSGGQKQRLAIARAIIRNPTIVLLDEATSALDSKAEALVQGALDEMVVGNNSIGCTIVIAHRLSTVKQCDRIFVMDKGEIKESGPHDELLAIDVNKDASGKVLSGWYRDLWETQMGKTAEKGSLEPDQKKLDPVPTTSECSATVAALEARVAKLLAENILLRMQAPPRSSGFQDACALTVKPGKTWPPRAHVLDSSLKQLSALGCLDSQPSTVATKDSTPVLEE